MKIYNKIVLDKDNNIIEEDHFEYNGPISYCGGGGGSASEGASGSDKAAFTGDAAYSGSTKPSAPPGGGDQSMSYTSPRDYTMADVSGGKISSTGPGPGGQGARGQDTQNPGRVGRQDQMGGKPGLTAAEMRDVDPSSFRGSGNTVTAEDLHISIHGKDLDGRQLDQEEIDAASQRVSAGTNQNQRQDLTFQQHWANRPNAIKFSPTLSFLYASGKNIGEFFTKGGGTYTAGRDREGYEGGDSESQMMRDLAPHAPYIVSGTTAPSNSPAANWYQGLGGSSTNPNTFNLATELAAAKSKQAAILGNSSAVGMLAANQTPYFDFLQKHSLTKGIL